MRGKLVACYVLLVALAHIRLFTGIAFARHPGAAHAAEFFVPRLVG